MNFDQTGYDLHLLICTNTKEKGESCGPKGAQDLVDHFKGWVKAQGFVGKVRVNKSGCLGKCESGIACVAYPKGEWALKVSPSDLPALEVWLQRLNSEN